MSAADKIAEARDLAETLRANQDALTRNCADDAIFTLANGWEAEIARADAQAQRLEEWRQDYRALEGAHRVMREANARLIAERDAQAQENARLREAVTVDVKPLEWRDLTYGMNPHWTANHPFGSIDIRQEDEDLEWRWVVRPFIGGRSNWPTLEEAKADAEADYRARIRAALGDAP